MSGHSGLSEGFRRLAVVAGIVAALFMIGGWVNNMVKAGDAAALHEPVMWAIPILASLLTGVAAWGVVRLLGWVVAGFIERRPPV